MEQILYGSFNCLGDKVDAMYSNKTDDVNILPSMTSV